MQYCAVGVPRLGANISLNPDQRAFLDGDWYSTPQSLSLGTGNGRHFQALQRPHTYSIVNKHVCQPLPLGCHILCLPHVMWNVKKPCPVKRMGLPTIAVCRCSLGVLEFLLPEASLKHPTAASRIPLPIQGRKPGFVSPTLVK